MEYDICQAHINVAFNTEKSRLRRWCGLRGVRDLYEFPSKPLGRLGILDCSKLLHCDVSDIVSTYKYLIWQTSSCFLVPPLLCIIVQIYFDFFFCFNCGYSLLGIGLRYTIALVIKLYFSLVQPV